MLFLYSTSSKNELKKISFYVIEIHLIKLNQQVLEVNNKN